MAEDVVVAVELVPGGGVTIVTLRLGEMRAVSLRKPVVGGDATQYAAMDISVGRTVGATS